MLVMVMVSADSIFTQNSRLLSIALVNWFAGIFGASNPITLESKRIQAAGMTEVWAPLVVVGVVKLMASWSHGLPACLMMD